MQFPLFTSVEATMSATLNLRSKIFMLGSCFADSMYENMSDAGLSVNSNPFGTTYNPISLSEILYRLIEGNDYTESELFNNDGLWHSYMHHGSFSKEDKQETLTLINLSLQQGRSDFLHSDVCIFTFGTAWVYELKETGKVVNNCHKMSQNIFNRRLLSVEEIVETWLKQLSLPVFDDKTIIFTISPIRHKADGMHGNTISKSTLQLAVAKLAEQETLKERVSYFPSYEILLDELRDYRWFSDDLCHPSKQAVQYIWEKFRNSAFSKQDISAMDEIHRYRLLCRHRPLHPTPDKLAKLQRQIDAERQSLQSKYGSIILASDNIAV